MQSETVFLQFQAHTTAHAAQYSERVKPETPSSFERNRDTVYAIAVNIYTTPTWTLLRFIFLSHFILIVLIKFIV